MDPNEYQARIDALVGAEPAKKHRVRDVLHKAIDIYSTPQYGLVGALEEIKRRDQGLPSRSLGEAIQLGIRRKEDFTQLTGNKPLGIALNLVADPMFPILGGVGKLAHSVGVVEKAVPLARKVPLLRGVIDELGRAFSPGYRMRVELGLPELDELRVQRELKARAILGGNLDQRTKDIVKLVPETSRREQIYTLLEEPLDRASPEYYEWQKGVAGLSGSERKGYELMSGMRDEFEGAKVATGVLEQERATGLEARQGVRYAPRYLADPKDQVRAIRQRIAEITTYPELKIKDESAEALEQWASSLEKMPESSLKQKLYGAMGRIGTPKFLEQRELPSLRKIGKLSAIFDQDVARVMEKERIDVAKALANKEYLDSVKAALAKGGLGKELGEGQKAGDLVPLTSHYKGFENFVVPKEIAREVGQLTDIVRDPERMEHFFRGWRKSTQWWKAWTLFVIPEFHSRQWISNEWMKYLAGMDPMDPRNFGHYAQGRRMALRYSIMRESPDATHVVMKNWTEKDLVEAMMREGMIGGGRVGEVREFLNAIPTGSKVAKAAGIAIGRQNPALRLGRNFAAWEDDSQKISMFLWRLGKGETFEQAGKFTRHHMYDPDLIMTSFEKKYLRDAMIPFWGWLKFNLPLQVEMLITYPQRFAQGIKSIREWERLFGGPEPTNEFLPVWMQNSSKMRVRWNESTGSWEFLTLGAWWPAADLEKITGVQRAAKELWNMVTPLVKEPVEWITGWDLYSFKPIERFPGEKTTLRTPFGSIEMRKRLESALRFFRPINVAHHILESGSVEFAGTENSSRIKSYLAQTFLGRVYPINRADQKEYWRHNIEFQIREMKSLRHLYVRKGDRANLQAIDANIKDLEDTRREFLTKE